MTRDSDNSSARWLTLFVGVGVGLRLARYALAMPIWGDEAMLGINVLQRGYADLLHPLDNFQVAPIGFLWSERFAYQLLGMSEYAMRLLPMLAGIVALILFAIWARLLASARAAALAVGILAVGYYSVRYAVELKPYGYDLCAAMLLLLPATLFLLRGRAGWLWLLIALTPLALLMSFPVLFTAGGIAVGLAWSLRRGPAGHVLLAILFILVLGASFGLITLSNITAQYQAHSPEMLVYWTDAFPPAQPLQFLWWLIRTHTGNMFAYPVGGKNGASTASFLLFIVGIVSWLRTRPPALLAMFLTPFVLLFIAAALGRYPYGDSARISQPLAPVIILMIALGLALLLDKLTNPDKALRVACVILLCVGAGVLVDMVRHPYYTRAFADARQTVRHFLSDVGPQATVAVVQSQYDQQSNATLRWYLLERKPPVIWDALHSQGWGSGPVWVISLRTTDFSALTHHLGRQPRLHEMRALSLMPPPHDKVYWELWAFEGSSATSTQ